MNSVFIWYVLNYNNFVWDRKSIAGPHMCNEIKEGNLDNKIYMYIYLNNI